MKFIEGCVENKTHLAFLRVERGKILYVNNWDKLSFFDTFATNLFKNINIQQFEGHWNCIFIVRVNLFSKTSSLLRVYNINYFYDYRWYSVTITLWLSGAPSNYEPLFEHHFCVSWSSLSEGALFCSEMGCSDRFKMRKPCEISLKTSKRI